MSELRLLKIPFLCLLAGITLCFGCLFSTAEAALESAEGCTRLLVSTTALPRELNLNEEAQTYLMGSEPHRELLESLARIFAVLNDRTINSAELGAALAEEPEDDELGGSDLSETGFFSARPQLLTDSVRISDGALQQSVLRSHLSRSDLAILAYLLNELPRNRRDIEETIDGRSASKISQYFATKADHLKSLLNHSGARENLAEILSLEPARAYFLWSSTRTKIDAKIDFVSEAGLDDLQSRLLKGRLEIKHRYLLRAFTDVFLMDIYQFGLNRPYHGENEPVTAPDQRYYIFERDVYRANVDRYFAEKLQAKKNLQAISVTMDYMAFGIPLPKTPEQLYGIAIETAKRLLLPLKNEFNRVSDQRRKDQIAAQPKSRPVVAYQLRLRDDFEPKSSPYIRTAKKPELHAGENGDKLPPFSENSKFENSLRNFTSFVSSPRPLNELKPNFEYAIWFLRESAPKLERIRFSTAAVEWIQQNPVTGQNFLNALHMGRARMSGQAGIKLLFNKSLRTNEVIYELKSNSSYRGLLIQIGGQWQLISVAHKDELRRSIEILEPLQ